MKKFLKVFAILLVFVLSITVFAACGEGGGEDGGDDNGSVAGETQEWGNISILVPDGYTLNGGDMFDKEDPDKLTLNGPSTFDYFMVTANWSEESAKSSIDTTRSLNEGAEDVEITAGGNTWTGVSYDSLGYEIIVVYAPMGDGYTYFTSCSHGKDDATFKAVLESITVK